MTGLKQLPVISYYYKVLVCRRLFCWCQLCM